MTPMKTRVLRLLTAVVSLCFLLSLGVAGGSTVKWAIVVLPAGAGNVVWSTSSPAANGSIDKYRAVTFDKGGFIDLTFQAAPGYELTMVTKNADDWTPYLDASHHFQFGPVDQAHLIVARYSVVVPTGSFGFSTSGTNPLIPNIVDITGHYTGIGPTTFSMTPQAFPRPYAGDVTMDETGKLDILGTIEGIVPAGGGDLTGLGTVTSVNDTPTAWVTGRFNGTRDGVAGTSTGSVGGDVVLTDVGSGTTGVEGDISYKCVAEGVSFADKNVPVTAPVAPASAQNLHKSWTLALNISEKMNTGKKRTFVASAQLTLPNGDRIQFGERPVKYNPKKGYTLSFKKGLNVTRQPNVVDKKTTIGIKGLTLTKPNFNWVPSGGTIAYKFLGQKGAADLMEFVP